MNQMFEDWCLNFENYLKFGIWLLVINWLDSETDLKLASS